MVEDAIIDINRIISIQMLHFQNPAFFISHREQLCEQVLGPNDAVHTIGRLLSNSACRVLLLCTGQRKTIIAIHLRMSKVLVALTTEPHRSCIKEVDLECTTNLIHVRTCLLIIESHDHHIEFGQESHPIFPHTNSIYMCHHPQLRSHDFHCFQCHLGLHHCHKHTHTLAIPRCSRLNRN